MRRFSPDSDPIVNLGVEPAYGASTEADRVRERSVLDVGVQLAA
jgi:hypothetical protein